MNTNFKHIEFDPLKDTIHLCNFCQKSFPSRNKLFRHINTCFVPTDDDGDKDTNNSSLTLKRKMSNLETEKSYNNNNNKVHKEVTIRPKYDIRTVQEDDNWYRVLSKPQGLATMGHVGHETLMNSSAMLFDNAIENQLRYKKAVPCHRLDRATGGLVICSKSKEAHSSIMASFRDHEIFKRYRAIVKGRLVSETGIINFPISGQKSETKYFVVSYTRSKQYEWVTTVDLWPLTGRKHQLRKHLQELGHPIIGDERYSFAQDWPGPPYENMMFLWALEIHFPHKGMNVISTHTTPSTAELNTDTTTAINTSTTTPSSNEEMDTNSNQNPSISNINHVYPIVKVSIEEPPCYEEFRQFQHNSL